MLWRRLFVPGLLALAAQAALAQGGGEPDVDVVVELDQFGPGNSFRPGEDTAIRIMLTSRMNESVSCWVQWEVPNAEGDIGEYGRSVSLGPGARSPVWLYAPLPPSAAPENIWTVRVFEERDGKRRRELGGARISPSDAGAVPCGLDAGLIAVVGRARIGLDGYGNTWNLSPNPPGAHEETRLVSLSPPEMPDRWEGLRLFEAVVWGDAQPEQLRADSAAALRDYVHRGGHLVIVLPDAGNPWGLGARGQTWLEDLLPQQAPRRDEGVKLSALMPLLSKSFDPPPRDVELNIRVFKEIGKTFDVLDNRYEPLFALPDGRVVVIQRIVGFGRITVLGIDLTSQQIASMRLPEADAFWNRILGRRADTPSKEDVQAMHNSQRLRVGRGNDLSIDGRMLERNVNKPGRAAGGLAASLLLFGAYFFVALGSFFALRVRHKAQHSWLAFAGASAVFTAIAWGGVRIMRQQNTELRHVTVLDHVVRPNEAAAGSEPQYQRATCWSSLFVPGYGRAHLRVASEPMQRDLILPWSAPEKEPERFPNVDRYPVDVGRAPAEYAIPARATAAQVRVDWMGALDPQWGGTFLVDPEDPIRVEGTPPATRRLTGSLISDLPGPISHLWLIWVDDWRLDQRTYSRDSRGDLPWQVRSGEMLNTGHMWSLDASQPWYPDTNFSLRSLVPSIQTTGLANNIDWKFVKNFVGMDWNPTERTPPDTDALTMLSFYHQLTPPKYVTDVDGRDPETVSIRRLLGRELDLSAWFNRPCIILIGFLEDTPSPVPLLVDGRRPKSVGLTVVRWIYPLPVAEKQLVYSVTPKDRPPPEPVRTRPDEAEKPAPPSGRRNRR